MPLHTNFSLDSAGEYLALTDGGGLVISRLEIPALAADQSYGPGVGATRDLAILTTSNANLKWSVPVSAVGDEWRGAVPFDDSAWTTGQGELGFKASTTTAYSIPRGTVGGQSYAGSLGMDFDVVRPVQVTELGCFDSGSNGLSSSITVVLWSRNQNGTPGSTGDDVQGSVLASQVFTTAAPGTLVGGQRFKTLTSPVTLAPGSYTILAYNYARFGSALQFGTSYLLMSFHPKENKFFDLATYGDRLWRFLTYPCLLDWQFPFTHLPRGTVSWGEPEVGALWAAPLVVLTGLWLCTIAISRFRQRLGLGPWDLIVIPGTGVLMLLLLPALTNCTLRYLLDFLGLLLLDTCGRSIVWLC
jgi:hypothetical protein